MNKFSERKFTNKSVDQKISDLKELQELIDWFLKKHGEKH